MLLSLFYASLALLLLYRLVLTTALLANSTSFRKVNQDGLSLVVCARNEAENLARHLPKWVDQSHPVKQIIVVNDGSRDDTGGVIKQFPEVKGVRIQPIDKSKVGKKKALELGVAISDHETIAVTDADCRPASKLWLEKMHGTLGQNDELVLGYAPIEPRRTLLNGIQRYDAWLTGLRSLGMASLGYAYMGVGRNMLYKRSLFNRAKRNPAYRKGIGGDDDLLVNLANPRPNTSVLLDPDTYVYTEGAGHWSAWFKKKRRHISSSKQYRWRDKIWLSVLGGMPILILISGMMLLFRGRATAVLAGLLIYFIVQWPWTGLLMSKMKERALIPVFPLLELAYWLYLFIMTPVTLVKSPEEW